MKSQFFNLGVSLSRVDSAHIKAVLTIAALALFALGAGAPAAYTGP